MQWVAVFFGACVVGFAGVLWASLRKRVGKADEE